MRNRADPAARRSREDSFRQVLLADTGERTQTAAVCYGQAVRQWKARRGLRGLLTSQPC